MKMLGVVFSVTMRDVRLALRRPTDVFAALFFFIMTASLFPLGVGPDPNLLRQMAPGVLWVGALLATLLALPRLFAEDFADGTLEQLALSANPLGLIVLGKAVAHWLLTGLPLALIAPLLGLQFDLSAEALWTLSLSLLIGTPALSGIGAIGAALTLGVKGGGVLLSLLVLPLYIPALVFGAGAVEAVIGGLGGEAHLSILAALSVGGLCFAPFAAAAALRLALE
jgi:heme exporter protein B